MKVRTHDRVTFFSMLALALSTFLVSCSTLSWTKANEENFRQVKVGQTKDEVENVIGKPEVELPTDVVSKSTTLKYQILRADRRSYDPYALVFKSGRLVEINYDTQSARDQVALSQQRGKSSQKCETMRPEISANNQKPDARPIPDSCEAAPPLK